MFCKFKGTLGLLSTHNFFWVCNSLSKNCSVLPTTYVTRHFSVYDYVIVTL